jgi:IS605 OrfB family transposase
MKSKNKKPKKPKNSKTVDKSGHAKNIKTHIIPKNVCSHSKKLTDEEWCQISKVFDAYGCCADLFYERFSSVQYMVDVKSWLDVRNKIRSEQHEIEDARKKLKDIESGKIHVEKKEYEHIKALASNKTLKELFCIQGRHWVMATKQTCFTINSIWSNMGAKIKTMVRDNKNDDFTDEMKSYCYYVLSVRELWQQVLMHKPLNIKDMTTINEICSHLTDKQIKRCNQYINRLTKRYRPHPKSHKHTCMLYDQEMYTLTKEEIFKGKKQKRKVVSKLQFTSNVPGVRFEVLLRSEFCYKSSGDIQLILNPKKKRLEIHKLIKARTVKIEYKSPKEGVDKGLYTLLSCSTNHEYGVGFSDISNKEAERLNTRNTERNRFIEKKTALNEQIKELDDQISRSGEYEKISLIRKSMELKRKVQSYEINNLGTKKYHKEHDKYVGKAMTIINHSIRQMIKNEAPKKLGLEDLSFTREKVNKRKGETYMSARIRRNLNSWTKGKLDDRIEYICSIYGIETVKVNPAYTSQFCPYCGAKLDERTGEHKEVAHCPNCGTLNANTSAAIVIRDRIDDPDITIYTPYKKVKEIMLIRYQQTVENQQKAVKE